MTVIPRAVGIPTIIGYTVEIIAFTTTIPMPATHAEYYSILELLSEFF